jgi:hypothetical protein
MTSRGFFIYQLFVSKAQPYGNTVKPGVMKYYAIYVSKIDWNNAETCTKFVACVCSECCKEKHFLEEVFITKKIYPVDKWLQEDYEKCRYIGTDGLLHCVECERTLVFQE